MKITIITLFPQMFEGFLTESIVGKAQKNGFVGIDFVNLRDFAKDKYGSVDDRPYGGGAGMVIRVDVIHDCLKAVLGESLVSSTAQSKGERRKANTRVILTSAKGQTFSQAKAEKYANLSHLVIIAGHYEGVDERVMAFVDDEISIGQYVLTGGELPAAVIADSVVRLIPGVLKKDDASKNESYSPVAVDEGHVRLKEYPHYTRPEEYMGMKVPDVLKSGNHKSIQKWKLEQSLAS